MLQDTVLSVGKILRVKTEYDRSNLLEEIFGDREEDNQLFPGDSRIIKLILDMLQVRTFSTDGIPKDKSFLATAKISWTLSRR